MEELKAKLITYEKSYAQIKEALQEEPNNEQLLKLKKEIGNAIAKIKAVQGDNTPAENELESEKNIDIEDSDANEVLTEGSPCIAQYSVDNKWYDAVIEKVTPTGVVVVYMGYGNKEELSMEHIKNPVAKEVTEKEKNKKRPIELITTNSGVHIPKALEIQPTDSADVRAVKKKKIKAIKSQNRLKEIEDDRNIRQQTWKDFAKVAAKKTPAAAIKRKESIFASNDTGKVGVTGSGKGMTVVKDFKTMIHPTKLKKGPVEN